MPASNTSIRWVSAKEFVREIFKRWEEGDSAPFFAALSPDVTWIAKGRTPISGTFHGKQDYLEKVYQPLLSIFTGATTCQVRRVLGEGNMVVVEWHGETPTADGAYSQDYCWLIKVSEDARTIQEVTGYFDTVRVEALFSPSPPKTAEKEATQPVS